MEMINAEERIESLKQTVKSDVAPLAVIAIFLMVSLGTISFILAVFIVLISMFVGLMLTVVKDLKNSITLLVRGT